MKKILTYLFLSVLFFTSCKDKPENAVADGTKKAEKINADIKDYTEKRVDDLRPPATGVIIGYNRDEEVKKIISERYADTSRTFTEYYFDDGMLVYVIRRNYKYNKSVSYTEEKARANNDSVWYDDKKTKMETSRFYFCDNKLQKWLAPGNVEIKPKTGEFIDKESELWAETIILIKELKEQ